MSVVISAQMRSDAEELQKSAITLLSRIGISPQFNLPPLPGDATISQIAGRMDDLAAMIQSVQDTLAKQNRDIVIAVVGLVSSKTYTRLADMMEYFDASSTLSRVTTARSRWAERNDAMRRAAASGDWATFDRVALELSGGNGSNPPTDNAGSGLSPDTPGTANGG